MCTTIEGKSLPLNVHHVHVHVHVHVQAAYDEDRIGAVQLSTSVERTLCACIEVAVHVRVHVHVHVHVDHVHVHVHLARAFARPGASTDSAARSAIDGAVSTILGRVWGCCAGFSRLAVITFIAGVTSCARARSN